MGDGVGCETILEVGRKRVNVVMRTAKTMAARNTCCREVLPLTNSLSNHNNANTPGLGVASQPL